MSTNQDQIVGSGVIKYLESRHSGIKENLYLCNSNVVKRDCFSSNQYEV